MKTQIHPEYLLTYYKNGIRVIPPEKSSLDSTDRTISQILKLKYNIYFHDLDMKIREVNEPGWQKTGWISRADAINQSVTKPCTCKTLRNKVRINELRVINEQKTYYFDEHAILANEEELHAISIKMPWYDEEDNLRGIFGCSLLSNNITNLELVKSISEINNLFVLRNIHPTKNSIKPFNFSQRQNELLYWYRRGKDTREIAKIMSLSYRTVEHYIINIKDKIGVNTKSELLDFLFDQYD